MIMNMKTLGESQGKYFMGKNLNSGLILPDTLQKDIDRAKLEKEKEEAINLLIDAEKQKQEEIKQKAEKLELLPMGNKIIILPYPRNPYRKIMEGNIFVDYDGTFKNPDSGEMDKQKELISCGKVIEVGSECKYVQIGDDVYYATGTAYPLPFMSLGYYITSEPQVIAFLNEGLKERLNK